jgi:hypothetical protein
MKRYISSREFLPGGVLVATSVMVFANGTKDRRLSWVKPERDIVPWDELTRAERSRRTRFYRMVSRGVHGEVALREVLELGLGPVPSQTQEEFQATWTQDFLVDLSDRWKRSPHFRGYAKNRTDAAKDDLCSRAPEFAQVLYDVALDPDETGAARVKAAHVALMLAGLIAGEKPLGDVRNMKEILKQRTRDALEASRAQEARLKKEASGE